MNASMACDACRVNPNSGVPNEDPNDTTDDLSSPPPERGRLGGGQSLISGHRLDRDPHPSPPPFRGREHYESKANATDHNNDHLAKSSYSKQRDDYANCV